MPQHSSNQHRNKKPPHPRIVLDDGRILYSSRAYLDLSGYAPRVFSLFLLRRQIVKEGRGGHERKVLINNGKIQFTCREAKNKWGISQPRFIRAIDQLVSNGLIDIWEPGNPATRAKTLFGMSERWKAYGTDKFIKAERTKGLHVGFCDPNRPSKARSGNTIESTANVTVPD